MEDDAANGLDALQLENEQLKAELASLRISSTNDSSAVSHHVKKGFLHICAD